jgi:hypothetical protein
MSADSLTCITGDKKTFNSMTQVRTSRIAYRNNVLIKDMSFYSKGSILGLYWASVGRNQNPKPNPIISFQSPNLKTMGKIAPIPTGPGKRPRPETHP